MFLIRSVFWLGLALFIIQPHGGADLAGSAVRLGTQAVDTGRTAAISKLDTVICKSVECAGVKFIAKSALTQTEPQGERVSGAPYPAPPLIRRPT